MSLDNCVFCKIAAGAIPATQIYEDEATVVFLDSSPLFWGHCLVCPKVHYDTLLDVPGDGLAPLFSVAQKIGRAVEKGLGAGGSFMCVNNKVSQSVPHLHVHVIPRSKGDGLKGFFWPRQPYRDKEHEAEVGRLLREALV